MTYRELTRKLKKLGCVFDRQGSGDHEIWINLTTRSRTTIPNWRSRDLRVGTVRAIMRDLDIDRGDFDRV